MRHKERLKQMRQNVDVLTMSATPIPRTLHMSLLGIRDMSVIETPPKDRLAIHTVVAHFDPELIRAAIEQELSPRRAGVLHPQSRGFDLFARRGDSGTGAQRRIGVGHGQMGEQELERVLLGFMRHEYDVFVCTTIVENGLDIPLANTIIIENAERYGLSELYQLRGRVGRSNRRAYAYLLVPAGHRTERSRAQTAGRAAGIFRPGRGLQDCRARSGIARRGQSAGRRTARPHRLGRLRHVSAICSKRRCRS